MLGGDEAGGGVRDDSRGLIQRVFEHLFARIAQAGGKHLLECSMMEIYNEVGGKHGELGRLGGLLPLARKSRVQ